MLSTDQTIDLVIAGRYVSYAGLDYRYQVRPTIKGAKHFLYTTNVDGRRVSYEDQYLGQDAFQGWEIVREGGKATWGMTYTGYINSDPKEVEKMLKFVLREEVARVRLGIPVTVERWGLVYQLRNLRKVSSLNFIQLEQIRRDGVELYAAALTAGGIMTLPWRGGQR